VYDFRNCLLTHHLISDTFPLTAVISTGLNEKWTSLSNVCFDFLPVSSGVSGTSRLKSMQLLKTPVGLTFLLYPPSTLIIIIIIIIIIIFIFLQGLGQRPFPVRKLNF
jgi:hypothetical protein